MKRTTYTSATTMIKLLEQRVASNGNTNNNGHRIGDASVETESKYDSFYGTESATEYLDLYKFGWKAGRDSLKNSVVEFMPRIKLELSTDVIGFAVSVPDYLSGNPENMLTMAYTQDKVIDIVVPMGWNAGVDSKYILAYGGVVTAVLKSLVDSGYKVNLKAITSTSYSNDTVTSLINIVDSNDILDIDKIASCFHTSFFRRAMFAYKELSDIKDVYNATCGGYGTSSAISKQLVDEVYLDSSNRYVYFPQLDKNCDSQSTLDKAIKLVKEVLNPE